MLLTNEKRTKKEKPKKKLTLRVIVYMLLSSLIITLAITWGQVQLDYLKEIKSIAEQKKQIEKSDIPALVNQLWVGDFDLLRVHLEGIVQLPYISYGEIIHDGNKKVSAGTSKTGHVIVHDFQMNYLFKNKDILLGTLHLEIDLDLLYGKLFTKLFLILGNQAAVIFLVSIFGFIIFQQLVMRHLNLIADYTRQLDISTLSNALNLLRGDKTDSPDELEDVVIGINVMRTTIEENISELKNEIEARKKVEEELKEYQLHLEDLIEERTYELQEKNNNIMDSLNYARMIQTSLLPIMDVFKAFIPECFVVWKPRDIVDGDIIFADFSEDNIIVAVIDCTGHGVPGAFMPMIASSGLRKIVSDEGCHDPAEILKRLNYFVKVSLQQDTDDAQSDDGMDMAICAFQKVGQTLTFAGAKHPLYCICDDELTVIKGDRQSIGYKKSKTDYHYTNHKIQIKEGMSFYLASDGYTDQLGGPKNRLFGSKRLKALIKDNYKKPFKDQRLIFMDAFEKYKGNNERQDDLTLFGFSITKFKKVTILFAGVRASDASFGTKIPYEYSELLESYFTKAKVTIEKHNGFISTDVDNSIMAFFPNDADDVLYAAKTLQSELHRFNEG